jgi:hypothetical protein
MQTTEDSLPDDLKTLLALWRMQAGTRRFPSRESFDGRTLMPWAGRLHLIEMLEDGDFYFHRFSPISAARLGLDMTGQRLSATVLDERATMTTSGYRRCLSLARPVCDQIAAKFGDGRHHTPYDRLMLPLGSNDRPNFLLVGLWFHPADIPPDNHKARI